MRRWDVLLEGYLKEYACRGRAAGTEARVAHVLERWGRWMKRCRPRVELERVDAELVRRYLKSSTSFRAKSTAYGILSVMRGMGDFLVREGVWASNPTRWMKGPKVTPYSRLPKRLDAKDLEALLHGASSKRGQHARHLWLTAVALLYGTGLRRGELERLDVTSWDHEAGFLLIDGRKTGRERRVPVPPLVYQCLEAYLPHRHNHLERLGRVDERALLVNRDGVRLSGTSISIVIHGIADRCGVRLHSLQQFRHTCASDLIAEGVGLAEVQQVLGHQGIATTVRYVHIADPERRAAMARHPINDWLRVEAA